MRRFVYVALIAALPGTALAQAASPSAEEMTVLVDWQNLNGALAALLQANKRNADDASALKQRLSDLDAYLKACGDKAGCTVPAAAK